MFLVDTAEGRIISDEEIKQKMAAGRPYRQWLGENLVHFDELPTPQEKQPVYHHQATLQRLQAFGYSFEDYVAVAERLDGVPGVSGLEVNISCPNVAAGCLEFGATPGGAAAVTRAVKAAEREFKKT